MMMRRVRGFTLIELLVVIAIIGILAAMLFPVFARARESARKIQCLSNVKNVAMAMQMYFTDYDRGMPIEHRAEVRAYFQGNPGGGTVWDGSSEDCLMGFDHANPYLRPPLILDEYIKNRDIWRCPSAKMEGGAMFIYGWTDWFAELQQYEGTWGNGKDICPKDGCYPNGWGGVVTDSMIQNMSANNYFSDAGRGAKTSAFVQSISLNDAMREVNLSSINDVSNTVACGDSGACTDFMSPGLLAYPDICAAECSSDWCGWADWENCGSYCDFVYSIAPMGVFPRNGDMRKQYTRHLGGINIGFMDGHAKWWSSAAFIAACTDQGKKGSAQPFGMWVWSGPFPQWCDFTIGTPTIWEPSG